MSVHAMDTTQGPGGLVSITLVFGKTPVIPHVYQVPVAQAPRLRAMHTAKAEYEQLAESIQTALRNKAPQSADYVINRYDLVYVYREGSKSWTGPNQVVTIDNKCVYVHLDEQFGPRAFNVAQLQPALTQQSENPANSIGSVPAPWPTRFTEY
jgi:hypothetical protein